MKDINIFSKEVLLQGSNEYEVLPNQVYVNNKTKLKILHKICNTVYEVRPNDWTNGNRCPVCNNFKRRDIVWFKDKLFQKYSNEYEVLPNQVYINNRTKLKVKHTKCNTIYEVRPNDILDNGNQCPSCFKVNKKSFHDFADIVSKEDGYTLIANQEYINSRTKMKVHHNACNLVYEASYDTWKQGKRCPYCRSGYSKAEQIIRKFFLNHDIQFTEQKTFDECKNIKPLKFDFYVPEDKTKGFNYNFLIEYNGIQHYQKSRRNNEDEYEKQKLRDNIKFDFVHKYKKKYNLCFLVISYEHFKYLEEILYEFFINGNILTDKVKCIY